MTTLSGDERTASEILVRIGAGRIPRPRCFAFCDENVFIHACDGPLRRSRSWAAPTRLPRLEASIVDGVKRRAANPRSTRNSLFIKLEIWICFVK